jgi:hypothetical protein
MLDMHTTESDIIDRCFSRFGAEPSEAQLNAVPDKLWERAANPWLTSEQRQDAADDILDIFKTVGFPTVFKGVISREPTAWS